MVFMPIYYGEVSHKGDNAGSLRTVNGVTDESAIASIFKVRPPKSGAVSSNSKIPASDLFNADDNQLYIDPSEMSVVTDNLAFFRRYKDSIPTDRANSLAVYLQQHYRSQLVEYARNLQPSQDFNLLDKKSIQAVALGLIDKLTPQEVVEQIQSQKPISEYSLLRRHVEMLLHGMSEQFEFNVHGLDVALGIKLLSISFNSHGIKNSFKIDFVRVLGSFDSLGTKASGAKSSYLKLVEDIKKLPKNMDSTFKFENDWEETSFGELKNARQYLEFQSEFKRMLKRNMWKVKSAFVKSAEAIEIPVEDEEVLTKYNFARAIANFYNDVGVAKSNLGIRTASFDQESLESLSAGTISSKEFMLANNDVFARRFKAYLRKVYKSENANANYADRLISELSPAVVKQMKRATLEFKVSEQVAKATEAYFAEEIESLDQAWELLGVYKSFNQIKDKAIMDRARTAIEALLPSWQGDENLSKADISDALKQGLKAVIDETLRVEGSFSGDFDKYVSELYSKLSTTLTDDVTDFIKAHSNEDAVGLTKDNVEEQAKIWMVTYKRDDILALIKKKQLADTPVEYLFTKIKSKIDARLGANLADYTIQHEDVTATERLKTIIENKLKGNQVANVETLANDNAKYTGFENEVVLAFIDSINRSYASDKRNIEEDSLTAYGQVHADKITAFLDDNLKGKDVDVATRKKAQEKLLDLAVEHELKPFLEVKAQGKLDFKFKLSMLNNRLEVLKELSYQCPADFNKDYYVSALEEFNNSFEDITNEVGQDKVNEVLKQLRNKAEAYDFGFVLRELVMFWPFNKDTFTRYLNDAVVNEVKARIDAKDEAVLNQLKPVLLGEVQLDEASSKLFVDIKNDIVNDRDDAMYKVIKNRMESYCEENRTKVFDRLKLGVLVLLKRYYFDNISEMVAEKLDSPEVKVTPDDARRFDDYLHNKIVVDLKEAITDGLANLSNNLSALALAKTTVEEIAGDLSETDIDARILAEIEEDLEGFIENNHGVTDDYRTQYYQRAMGLVDTYDYHYVIANLARRVNVTDYDEQSVTSWIKRMLKHELKRGNVRPVEYDLMRYGMNPPRDLDNIIGYELNEMINTDLSDSDSLKEVMLADGNADDTVSNYIDAFKRLLNRLVKDEVKRFADSHGIEITEEYGVLTWVKDSIEAELANESSEVYRNLEYTALTLVWEKANKGDEYDFAEIAESDVVDVIETLLEEREVEFRKQCAGGTDKDRLQKVSNEVATKLAGREIEAVKNRLIDLRIIATVDRGDVDELISRTNSEVITKLQKRLQSNSDYLSKRVTLLLDKNVYQVTNEFVDYVNREIRDDSDAEIFDIIDRNLDEFLRFNRTAIIEGKVRDVKRELVDDLDFEIEIFVEDKIREWNVDADAVKLGNLLGLKEKSQMNWLVWDAIDDMVASEGGVKNLIDFTDEQLAQYVIDYVGGNLYNTILSDVSEDLAIMVNSSEITNAKREEHLEALYNRVDEYDFSADVKKIADRLGKADYNQDKFIAWAREALKIRIKQGFADSLIDCDLTLYNGEIPQGLEDLLDEEIRILFSDFADDLTLFEENMNHPQSVEKMLSDYIALFMDTLTKAHSTPLIKFYADEYGIVVYDEEKVLAWLKDAVKTDVESKQGLTYDRIKEHALTLEYDELDDMSVDDLTDAMELIMTDRKEEFKKVCADSVTTELLKEKAIRMFMDKVQTYLAGEELTWLHEHARAGSSESVFNTEELIRQFSRYDGALSKKYITEKLNGLDDEELTKALEEIVYGKQPGELEVDYMLNQAPKDAERAIIRWTTDNETTINEAYVQLVQERLKNLLDGQVVDAKTILNLTKELYFALSPSGLFEMLGKDEEMEDVAFAIKHHLTGHKPTDKEVDKFLEKIKEHLDYHNYHDIVAELTSAVGITEYDYEALVPQIKSMVRSDISRTNPVIAVILGRYGANYDYHAQLVIEDSIDELVRRTTHDGKALKEMIGGGDADYVNNYDYVVLSKKVTSLKKIKDEIVAEVVEAYPVYGKYLGENVAIYVTEGIAQDVIARLDYVKEAIKSYRGDMEMVAYKLTTEGINRHFTKALKTALGTINVDTIKEQGIETFAEFADGILSTKELEWIQRKVGSLKDVNIFGGNVSEEQELMRTYADKELSKLDNGALLSTVEDLMSAQEDSQLVKSYAQIQVEKDAETAVRKRLDSKVGEIQKNFLSKMQAEVSKALGTDLVPLDEVEGAVNELGLGATAYQAFVGTYNSDIVKSYVNELKEALAVDVEEIKGVIKDVFANSVLKIVQNQTRFNGAVIYKGLLVKMFGDDYAEVISYVLSNIDEKDYVTGELVNSLRKNRGNLGDAIVSYLDNNEDFKQKVTTLAGVYVEDKARKYIDMTVRDAFNSAETVQTISKGIKTFRDKTKYINLKPSDLSVDKLSLTTVKDPFDFDVQGYVLEGPKIKYLVRLFDPVISDATINVEEVSSSGGNANEFKKRLSNYINVGFKEVFLKQVEIDGEKMQNDFMKFGEVDNLGRKYAEEHGTDEFEAYSDEYESGNVESVSDYLEKYLPYNVVSVYYPAYAKAQETLAKKAVKKFSEAGYEMTGDMNEDRVYSYYKSRPDDAVVFLRANANVAKEAEKFVVEKD